MVTDALVCSSVSMFFAVKYTFRVVSAALYSVFGFRTISALVKLNSNRPAVTVAGASMVGTTRPFFSFQPPVASTTRAAATMRAISSNQIRRCR